MLRLQLYSVYVVLMVLCWLLPNVVRKVRQKYPLPLPLLFWHRQKWLNRLTHINMLRFIMLWIRMTEWNKCLVMQSFRNSGTVPIPFVFQVFSGRITLWEMPLYRVSIIWIFREEQIKCVTLFRQVLIHKVVCSMSSACRIISAISTAGLITVVIWI